MEFSKISNLELIFSFFAFVSYCYLGLAVYFRDPKSWTNRLFSILTLILSVYTILNLISLHPIPPSAESQLFWIRMDIFIVSFIGPVLFLLVHTFPKRAVTLRPQYIALVLAIAIANAIASLTSLVFESISYPDGRPVPAPGKGMFIFVINFPIVILVSFGLLIKKYLRALGKEKVRLRYFLIGVVITFSLMVIMTIMLVVVFKTPAGVFIGPMAPLILVSFVAYAIVKHQFLDIHPIILRAVSFFIVTLVVASAYIALIVFVVRKLLDINIDTVGLAIMFIPILIGMISFNSLLRVIEKITDRLFFKREYDKDSLFSLLTRIMAETIDLRELINKVLRTLTQEMKISKGAFIIIDNHHIMDVLEVGFLDHKLQIDELEALFHKDSEFNHGFVLEELVEGRTKEIFRSLDISVAIPIRVEKAEVAILALGPKSSGERYFSSDISFLFTFASEAGIAIQNAKSFSRIKKFSKELEKRVEERTRELEGSQKRELDKAKDVARLKDEFVFIASHELRTPIIAIRGFLELVQESQKNFPKDIQGNLSAISAASNHLNQLIHDLLEIARSEGDSFQISSEILDIAPIIESVISELSALAHEKGVKMEFQTHGVIPMIRGDTGKIGEVLTNFISNAIKYNKEKGSVSVNILTVENELVVEVRDTGFGIPKNKQAEIFKKFFRAPSVETQEVLGTGLGLFISRMLVEKMGGRVMFSSVEDKGSTFAFSLPIIKNNAASS